ncbi:hypothetical protein M3Y97_00294600 [Aphelenchoides bicaudatus]|nr:hypothetical protein M3Y97_00294600 [Aphelenchoides bicaudatus]
MSDNANQENTANGQTTDLQMYWKISEYFETLQLVAKRPDDARPLVKKLCKELDEFVKDNPITLSRQLPILLNYIQILLNMNIQQAVKIDSYGALLHSISIVSSNSRCVFENTEAFETFLELFLNEIAISLFQYFL